MLLPHRRAGGCSGKGRHGQAARRRRAHPLGSTHAGEGAGDGAMAASLAASLHRPLFRLLIARLRLRCAEEKRERGDERESTGKNEARVFPVGRGSPCRFGPKEQYRKREVFPFSISSKCLFPGN